MKSVCLLETSDEVARILAALGNQKRLAIMCHLKQAELSVGEIAGKVELSQSALSQHLAKLREVGLVATRRDRQMIYYSCPPGLPTALLDMLEKVFFTATQQH